MNLHCNTLKFSDSLSYFVSLMVFCCQNSAIYETLFIHTDICLSAHNKLRALHRNTPPFVWDDQLAADSQKWADYLSRRGSLTHDMNSGVGENLYWSQSWRSATKGDSTAKAALAW